jgi:hypothetical protein
MDRNLRSDLDEYATELGITGTQALGDRELSLALIAALGTNVDGAVVGHKDPTPLRSASTTHLMRRASVLFRTRNEQPARALYRGAR